MSAANETYKKSPIIRYDLVEREYDKFWVRVYSKNRYFDEIVYRKLCLNTNENKLAELKLMEKEDI